ncbi:MAG: DUF456 domain-containing protein [Paludibacteraceae bacterium]|nr:DUF456 domain-containing protein [Paludibacteraceae bacterium]
METVLLVLSIMCFIIGLVGCVVPALPGVPFAYAGLLLAHLSGYVCFSLTFLIGWGAAAVVLMVLDYVVPAWGTRKFGGTRWGVWGSTLGLIVGLFFSWPGIVLGPFIGAFAFELLQGAGSEQAFRAAFGSLIGLLLGTVLKLVCCGAMLFSCLKQLL